MYFNRLEGERFFARIWGVDLECPACGRIALLDTHAKGSRFTSRTPRFECEHCREVFVLGVLAWRPDAKGKKGADGREPVPPDVIPTVDQSRTLSELMGGRMQGKRRKDLERQVNVVMKPACTCRYAHNGDRRIQMTDPGCPIDGPHKPGEMG